MKKMPFLDIFIPVKQDFFIEIDFSTGTYCTGWKWMDFFQSSQNVVYE